MASPEPQTIAFALAVLHSKPPELSVEEYIELLKQHIAKGRRADAITSQHRHLDRSAYWRSQYQGAQDALRKAETQAVDLRMEIESLKAKAEVARPTTSSRKRKKQDEDTVLVPRSPKKAKRTASPTRFAPLEIKEDVGVAGLDETGTTLVRSVFDIHAIVKARGKTDTTSLAYHIIRAASAISDIVKQHIEQCLAQDVTGLENLTGVLTVSRRAVASIFVGINRIGNVPEGSVVQGKVVHAVVKMFKGILSEFEWLASAEVDKTENEASSSKDKRPSTGKAKSKAKSIRSTMMNESSTLNVLTAFLASVIDSLDPKVESNKTVFEGVAFCVIRRLGDNLYPTIFGHRRAPTLEAEILQSKAVDEIEDDDYSRHTQQDNEQTQKRVRIEAPYLIHLFSRIMAIAPAHLGAALSTKTGKPKQANNKGYMKGALTVAAKDCLQRTLVNAIFGTEGTDENDPFMDCLKMPLPGNATIPMPKVKEAEVGEWFKGELWGMLGWEILEKIDGK